MKLLVITAAYFPFVEIAQRKLWIYLKSCRMYGIDPVLIGTGCLYYPGLVDMRINGILHFLNSYTGDATHVLYSDGWDAFFTAPMEEILLKYNRYGAPPILIAASPNCGNIQDVDSSPYAGLFDTDRHYRYPGLFYIAEIPTMIRLFQWMKQKGLVNSLAGDDHTPWLEAWKEHYQMEVDWDCHIFQGTMDGHCVVEDGRIHNRLTGSTPAIVHFGGGYCDPVYGKDPQIIPWARAVGILQPDEEHP